MTDASHSLTRRTFLGTAAAGALACAGATGAPRRKPNVIFLFADEHRYQSMSFTEMPEMETPHMAQMAKEGVHFRQCVSNYPVCSPFRAMLLTGRWPYETGVTDNRIPLQDNEITIAKAFKSAGYSTGYIGKWHLTAENRAEPFGFDMSLAYTGTGAHYNKSKYHPKDGKPVTAMGYNATVMTDQALAFMDDNKDDPFFLIVSWDPPHSNFLDAPEEKKKLYPDGSLPFRKNFMEANHKYQGIFASNGTPYYEGYHAHISAIDDELGRIFSYLKQQNLEDDTIVVYSSDHGSMHGSHGFGSKRQPYEESVRIPCMFWGPGHIKAKGDNESLIGSIDFMPTVLGLAGVAVPDTCSGRDFSFHLRGEHGPEPLYQFIMHIAKDNASRGNNHPAPIFRGVRTHRYTYAIDKDGVRCVFDNQQDPYQMRNLAGTKQGKAIADKLSPYLREALTQAKDPYIKHLN